MNLTNRLETILSMVPISSTVADIGTDHAYLPINLIRNKICRKVIATDVNTSPTKKAQLNVEKYKLSNQIEVRQGSGLEPLDMGEADTVIIAGMGGILIKDMLAEAKIVLREVKTLILQPMNNIELLRQWLYSNKYRIADERLSKEEDRIYTIIIAEHGEELIEDEIYYFIGKKLIENGDPLLKRYLGKKINELKEILDGLSGGITKEAKEKQIECHNKLNRLYEIYYHISE